MDEKREKGLEIFGEVFGEAMAEGIAANIEAGQAFGLKQSEWTLDWTFGSLWASDDLERKLRSCVVLGLLMGLRAFDEIKAHTKIGIANGLTRKEFEQIFYTAIPYAGFPAAATAKNAMLEAFAEVEAAERK